MLEETGCLCDEIKALGYIYENRAYCDLQQYSYIFSVSAKEPPLPVSFTIEEIKAGTKLLWRTLEEAVYLIESGKPKTNQQIFLKARDMAAMREFLSPLQEKA